MSTGESPNPVNETTQRDLADTMLARIADNFASRYEGGKAYEDTALAFEQASGIYAETINNISEEHSDTNQLLQTIADSYAGRYDRGDESASSRQVFDQAVALYEQKKLNI